MDMLLALKDAIETDARMDANQKKQWIDFLVLARKDFYNRWVKEDVHRALFASFEEEAQQLLEKYLDEVEALIFDRLLPSPQRMRIMSELMPKVSFHPAFVMNRKVGFENGIEIMSEKLRSACGDRIAKRDIMAALKMVGVFLAGLITHSTMLESDDDTRDVWERFRVLIKEQLGNEKELVSAGNGGAGSR